MLETNKTLPRGTYARAAKELGVSPEYISQVVAGDFGETDRVVEVWEAINKCADTITEERELRKSKIARIKERYAA